MPVAVLRPMIGATEAVSRALVGVRNAVDPEMREDIENKFKDEDHGNRHWYIYIYIYISSGCSEKQKPKNLYIWFEDDACRLEMDAIYHVMMMLSFDRPFSLYLYI